MKAPAIIKTEIEKLFCSEQCEFKEEKIDIIFQHGSPIDIFLYLEIIYPDFVDIDDSIILSFRSINAEDKFIKNRKINKRSIQDMEESFNMIEIGYLFANNSIFNEKIEYKLANVLINSWKIKLNNDFPNRKFHVYVLNPEETGSVVGITFHEIRNKDEK